MADIGGLLALDHDTNFDINFGEKSKFNNGKIKISKNDNSDSSDSEFSDNKTFDSNFSNNSDDGYHGVDPSNPSSVLDKISSITNNRKFEACVAKHNKFDEKNTWMRQYDQMTFDNVGDVVSSNNVNKNLVGKYANISRIELERDMDLNGGFSLFDPNDDGTYGVIHANSPEFIHENMLPNVRKGPNPIQENNRAMVNQRTLDLFTGSANNIDWRPKTERAPLFSPLIGVTNIYGDPVRTEEYKDRYLLSNNRNNELPFQQIKVTPGLNIGYNTVGKHGYHDMYRPTYRTTDEIRTLNKPKISYGSYSGPGQKGENGPIVGKVTQYRPQRFRERGTKDMVRGRSYITAPTIYGEYDPKNLATDNRGTKETPTIGPAQHYAEGNTPSKFRGNWKESRRENYKYDHPRNIIAYESLAGKGHNNDSFVPDKTQRNEKPTRPCS